MKRVLFIVALMLASTLSTLAQTILGVKVGESYVESKKILEKRVVMNFTALFCILYTVVRLFLIYKNKNNSMHR